MIPRGAVSSLSKEARRNGDKDVASPFHELAVNRGLTHSPDLRPDCRTLRMLPLLDTYFVDGTDAVGKRGIGEFGSGICWGFPAVSGLQVSGCRLQIR